MRLVIAAAAPLLATHSFAFAAPPPPPPSLAGSVPAEIGGYSTGSMNARYRYWLRRRSNTYALDALNRFVARRAEDSQGQDVFVLREGPRLSFLVSLDDGADHYAF